MSYCVQVFNIAQECLFEDDGVVEAHPNNPLHFSLTVEWDGELHTYLFPWGNISEVRIWEEKDD